MAESHRLVEDIRRAFSACALSVPLSDSSGVGKVVYAHVLGQGLVFLNTSQACADLLDKRGAIYSDKPHLVMCGELYGPFNRSLSLRSFIYHPLHTGAGVRTWLRLRDTATG